MSEVQPVTAERPIEEVAAYIRQLRDVVERCADDAAMLDALRDLDGGIEAVLAFMRTGLQLAFRSERAAGEMGLVQFNVDADGRVVELWLDVGPDGCRPAREDAYPDTVIAIRLPVLLRIAFKRMTGADAYMAGMVTAAGDVVLATSLDAWFDPPELVVTRV